MQLKSPSGVNLPICQSKNYLFVLAVGGFLTLLGGGCNGASGLDGASRTRTAGQTGAQGSPRPAASATASDPSSAGNSANENQAANQPQAVAGSFLVDCGIANASGYGCVVRDPASGQKMAQTLSAVTVSVTYGATAAAAASVTMAAAADPWSFYFPVQTAQLAQLTAIHVGFTMAGTPHANMLAETLSYNPYTTDSPTAGTTALANATGTSIIAFVTSNVFVPGQMFHSKEEASVLCTAIANSPVSVVAQPSAQLKLQWFALLSDATTAASSYLPDYGLLNNGFVRPINSAGATIGANGDFLFGIGVVGGGISLDEAGRPVEANAQVWTGTNTTVAGGGGATSAADTCNSWTGGGASAAGEYGIAGATDATFTTAGRAACNIPRHLYCIGSTLTASAGH